MNETQLQHRVTEQSLPLLVKLALLFFRGALVVGVQPGTQLEECIVDYAEAFPRIELTLT